MDSVETIPGGGGYWSKNRLTVNCQFFGQRESTMIERRKGRREREKKRFLDNDTIGQWPTGSKDEWREEAKEEWKRRSRADLESEMCGGFIMGLHMVTDGRFRPSFHQMPSAKRLTVPITWARRHFTFTFTSGEFVIVDFCIIFFFFFPYKTFSCLFRKKRDVMCTFVAFLFHTQTISRNDNAKNLFHNSDLANTSFVVSKSSGEIGGNTKKPCCDILQRLSAHCIGLVVELTRFFHNFVIEK